MPRDPAPHDGDPFAEDDPLAALAEGHARELDAECAAYLAAHGAEMLRELAEAGATWWRRRGA